MRRGRKNDILPGGKTVFQLLEERAPGLYDDIYDKFVVGFGGMVKENDYKIAYYKDDAKLSLAWIKYYSENDNLTFAARKDYRSYLKENKVYFECEPQNHDIIIEALENVMASFNREEEKGTIERRKKNRWSEAKLAFTCEEDPKKVEEARNCLIMLAENVDPITLETATLETLKRQEVKEKLLYCAELLSKLSYEKQVDDKILEANVKLLLAKIDGDSKPTFDKSKVQTSRLAVSVNTFLARINKATSGNGKKFTTQKIYDFLEKSGYVCEEEVQVVKTLKEKRLTDKGAEIGLYTKSKIDVKTGEITEQIVLSNKAQTFIIDNIQEIYGDEIFVEEGKVELIEEKIEQEAQVNSLLEDRVSIREQENVKIVNEAIPLGSKPRPIRVGEKWTAGEEMQLAHEYTELGFSISEIARIHSRKNGGIRARLKAMGLLK